MARNGSAGLPAEETVMSKGIIGKEFFQAKKLVRAHAVVQEAANGRSVALRLRRFSSNQTKEMGNLEPVTQDLSWKDAVSVEAACRLVNTACPAFLMTVFCSCRETLL